MADVVETPVAAEEVVDTPVEATEEAESSKDADELTLADLDTEDEDESPRSEESESEEVADEAEEQSEASAEEESQDEPEADQSDKTDTADTVDVEAERKRFNDEMAKQRIAEKRARQEAAEARRQLEQERIQSYLAEAEGDAEELAFRQTAVERYQLQQERAELNRERLAVSLDRAVAEIDIFRNGTDVQKKYLLKAVDLFEAQHVKKDEQGNPLEVTADLYQFLQKEADSIRELTQDGAVREAKTKENVKARTITTPTRTPKLKVDKDLEDFDNAFNY